MHILRQGHSQAPSRWYLELQVLQEDHRWWRIRRLVRYQSETPEDICWRMWTDWLLTGHLLLLRCDRPSDVCARLLRYKRRDVMGGWENDGVMVIRVEKSGFASRHFTMEAWRTRVVQAMPFAISGSIPAASLFSDQSHHIHEASNLCFKIECGRAENFQYCPAIHSRWQGVCARSNATLGLWLITITTQRSAYQQRQLSLGGPACEASQ